MAEFDLVTAVPGCPAADAAAMYRGRLRRSGGDFAPIAEIADVTLWRPGDGLPGSSPLDTRIGALTPAPVVTERRAAERPEPPMPIAAGPPHRRRRKGRRRARPETPSGEPPSVRSRRRRSPQALRIDGEGRQDGEPDQKHPAASRRASGAADADRRRPFRVGGEGERGGERDRKHPAPNHRRRSPQATHIDGEGRQDGKLDEKAP
ncbi:hypothetical protein [Marinactinospora rubrisoli]|uniref:Uncharacterized protein n=1 Tax=Marinactinospora rubrisoli TaxID=2715399 RepID=A0ABW2KG56_9ACTN